MFTIKHVHENGETLFRGDEPKFHPSTSGPEVSYENERGVRIYIVGGVVFVLNEYGQTVSTYQLDHRDPVEDPKYGASPAR